MFIKIETSDGMFQGELFDILRLLYSKKLTILKARDRIIDLIILSKEK